MPPKQRVPCQETDPDLWFPVGDSGPAQRQTEQAKVLCRQCPIRQECLDNALSNRIDYGIWGGFSPAERRAILARNPNISIRSKDADHRDRAPLTRALETA